MSLVWRQIEIFENRCAEEEKRYNWSRKCRRKTLCGRFFSWKGHFGHVWILRVADFSTLSIR